MPDKKRLPFIWTGLSVLGASLGEPRLDYDFAGLDRIVCLAPSFAGPGCAAKGTTGQPLMPSSAALLPAEPADRLLYSVWALLMNDERVLDARGSMQPRDAAKAGF